MPHELNNKPRDYAIKLADDSGAGKVRGYVIFEDRQDGFAVATIGSCDPIQAHGRMVLGIARWLVQTLI